MSVFVRNYSGFFLVCEVCGLAWLIGVVADSILWRRVGLRREKGRYIVHSYLGLDHVGTVSARGKAHV